MRALIKGLRVFILSILFVQLILFGFVTVASAQLSPKVLADKYLMQAEQLLEKKDYDGVLSLLDKIIALQKEHGFDFRDEFHFKHAQMAYSAGQILTAIDALHEYLAPETEGEFYKDALALLIKAEEEIEEVVIAPDKMCAGDAEGGSCWMALADRPECFVWNPNPQRDETVTWSGGCSGNVARGDGTLTWAVSDADTLRITERSTGRLRNGKFHGQWALRDPDGEVSEGSCVDGKRQGYWVTRNSNGDVTYEGPYVDGVKHGIFVWRNIYQSRMIQGSRGEFVHGKEEGRWLSFGPGPPGEQCSSATFRNGVRATDWRNVDDSVCEF